MNFFTLFVFLATCWGIGKGLGLLVRESEEFIERNIMRFGIGFGALPAIALLFNLLHIPLDWKYFFGIGSIFIGHFAFMFFKTKGFSSIKPSISFFPVLAIILFSITLHMHIKGAFSYPYLENDDPWGHASGIKYISEEKIAFAGDYDVFTYIEPYPPSYDVLLGIVYQTNDSLYWTMKFFNALIVSLSILFFFFSSKKLTSSPLQAILSTFALFAMPAFMSHFIWALSLAMPLFFLVFYAAEHIKEERKWGIITAILMATALTTTPSHSTYFALFFFIYLASKLVIAKKLLIWESAACVGGFLLSLFVWWLPMFIRYGIEGTIRGMGIGNVPVSLAVSGTGDQVYSFKDFFSTPASVGNLINNPKGIGVVLTLIIIFSIIFLLFRHFNTAKKHTFQALAIFLPSFILLITFLQQTYERFPVKRNLVRIDPGSVSFIQLFSEQSFVIITLFFCLLLLSVLLVALFKDEHFSNSHLIIAMAWFTFSFYAVIAAPYVVRLSPFRAWMVFAIPAALLAGYGMATLYGLAKGILRSAIHSSAITTTISLIFLMILVWGVIQTSFLHKYNVNAKSSWPPGGFWSSTEEIQVYLSLMQNLPKNSHIFTFFGDDQINAFDMYSCKWCPDVAEFKKTAFNQTPEDKYRWLKQNSYDYILFDGRTLNRFGINLTVQRAQEMALSGKFQPLLQTPGGILFKVN